jgi:hypothetical protein
VTVLQLAAPAAADDLATFARRASRHDAEAVIRVVISGTTAAFFAATSFDALALRTAALAEPVASGHDEVVEAVGLAATAAAARGGRLELPAALPALRWIGPLPPRSGWRVTATLPAADVVATVEAGIAEFRSRVAAQAESGLSLAAARAAMESVAADVWGRDIGGDATVGLAHAGHAFGFLVPHGEVVVRAAGPWRRLDGAYGTVLTRRLDPLGLLG